MNNSSELELGKKISDLADRAFRTNRITETLFLNPSEAAMAQNTLRTKSGVRFLFHGGFPDAERVRLFFLPDYIDEEYFPVDEYISVIKTTFSFSSPTHRDFLGSLIGLGIKREVLGDILVFPDRAYIICTSQIAKFIVDNLEKVGRLGIKSSIVPISEIEIPTPQFDTVTGTVASLRADSVTALAFGISRTFAADLIASGALSVNHLPEENISAEIREGCLLSLRGFGRAKLASVGGISKKGRHFLELYLFSKK